MNQSKIKEECSSIYAQISALEDRLKEIRRECTHPNTFIGNYQWRIGSSMKGEICEDCNAFIKSVPHE